MYNNKQENIRSHTSYGPILHGVPPGQDAVVLADLAAQQGTVLHVAVDDAEMNRLAAMVPFFNADIEVVCFPAWDCLPYDRVSPHAEIVSERVAALCCLLEDSQNPRLVLTTVNAVIQRVPPRDVFQAATFVVKKSARLDGKKLQNYLIDNGYHRTETVREPGEFAVRGSLIDIFPAHSGHPVRPDLFGDEVDSIREFDALSQRSLGTVEEFILRPVSEIFLNDKTIKHFRGQYREAFGAVSGDDPLYEAISEGRRYNGMEHWLPLFYETLETLFDYIPEAIVTFAHQADQVRNERVEQIIDFYTARLELQKTEQRAGGVVYHPVAVERLFVGDEEWNAYLSTYQPKTFSPFTPPHPSPLPPKGRRGGMLGKRQIPISLARSLRKNQTDAEDKLWRCLRNRQFLDLKFRRQVPIGPYVADFTCPEEKLIVELDGGQHAHQQEKDQIRTDFLESQGWTVVRFWNNEVIKNLESVLIRLSELVKPSPPLGGEGLGEGGAIKGRDFSDVRSLPDVNVYDAVKEHIEGLKKRVVVAAYSDGARERLKTVLKEHGVSPIESVGSWEMVQGLPDRAVSVAVLPLERGFENTDLAVITEQDILGDRLIRPARKKRKAEEFIQEISALAVGDFVVHEEHGIGQFLGLETLTVERTQHDCLKLLYANDDKLYLPVENIDVLSRYGSEEAGAHLDKLGGAGWQARKAKVKKDLMAMAGDLMKVAAARVLKKTEPMTISDNLYHEFAARFPYPETEDQARSIADVLEDLATPQAMDRLVCGDVGFGKTEVALRAAYVAAMAGYQVAVVVPTTLLCRQHYQGFAERFHGLPVRIAQLSRLVSKKDADLVKKEIASGDVNIVIGTHALLSNSVQFSNLGLLIVDEEQHFGVKQKERLKQLKANVHVLTLTATPIPRTLQLALTGVRELSLITTPPVDRLAVRTFVLPHDPVVIREALMREHHRGGQSFYVCPRIADLAQGEEQVKALVPDLKCVVAHGQMTPDELEDRMSAFYDGKFDVLLSTNIIESGLDIPNANTLVIHRSEMFGLGQLYQLRGRVGRSKVRAYAYLTYETNKRLTKGAEQRLHVIEQLDTLGAGFQLASHDLDIRGAGNLLGEEQSGHIREVGAELYQHMLEEAVAAAREGNQADTQEDRWAPHINIGTSVLIPETYVKDLNLRLTLYRRISELEEQADIESFAAELIDRFGALPTEVDNLLDIVAIKHLCRRAGVEKVEAGPKGATLQFRRNQFENVEGLVALVQEKAGVLKIRPDQRLGVMAHWPDPAERVKGVRAVLKDLAGLVAC